MAQAGRTAESLRSIMCEADIAFSSGGISMFELASVGTPNIVICQTQDEVRNAGTFVESGVVESLGLAANVTEDMIVERFRALGESRSKRESMSELGRELVDGKGLERILRVVDECMMQYSS